jgi:hypothetical protein
MALKQGKRIGSFSGVGIFKNADSTFVLIPFYRWWDLFLFFPVYDLYVLDSDTIAKVVELEVSRR